MLTLAIFITTIDPDFVLPNVEFDRKYCAAEVERVYAALDPPEENSALLRLRKARTAQRERMLRGLPPVSSQRTGNAVNAAPTQGDPIFAATLRWLTVHPDCFMPSEEFDRRYCQRLCVNLKSRWIEYEGAVVDYEHASTDHLRIEAVKWIEFKSYEIVKAQAELEEVRYYRRGRLLHGVPPHLIITD